MACEVKSTGTTYFPFAGYEVTGSVFTKYIRVGNETLAAKKGGDKLFYHNDHLGGVNVITNIFAVMVQLNEYDPWGKVSRSDGNGNAEPTKGFNGKELDPESGLYYYGGRYYDQQISRFVSADPYVQAPYDPQNLNRYSYVLDNPQRYIDPTGYAGDDTSGSYSIPLYGWVNLVRSFIDLFGSHHKHHVIPKPRYRGAATQPHAQLAKNRGQEDTKLDNVFVNDRQPSAGNDYPDEGFTIPARSRQMDMFYRSLPSGKRPGGRKGGALNPDCPPVPAAPCDVSLAENIGVARQHHWDPFWFYTQVRLNGPWDYKQQGNPRQYENFGNFHYGATGRAAGFPVQVLLRAAGWAAGRAGTSEGGYWWGASPYGDNVNDQAQIQAGVRYFELGCYEY